MLAEFAIVPIGSGESLSPVVTEMAKVVDDSGLDYQLTSMGTIVEGDWEEVLAVVKKCHDKVGEKFSRVYTKIAIDDRKGAKGRLTGKVESVKEKVGRDIRT